MFVESWMVLLTEGCGHRKASWELNSRTRTYQSCLFTLLFVSSLAQDQAKLLEQKIQEGMVAPSLLGLIVAVNMGGYTEHS